MTHVSPTIGLRRRAAGLLTAVLALGACGGGGGGAGGAGSFCRAVAVLFETTEKVAEGGAPAEAERDAATALEALPDDAPAPVRDYFSAFRQVAANSKVWNDPQTGGIKEEYAGDAVRLVFTLKETAAATGSYVAGRCAGAPDIPAEGPLSRPGGSGAAPGGQPRPAPSRPADVRVLLDDGPAGSYERVTVDIARVTATNAEPRDARGPGATATAANSLLVDVELAATTPAANEFDAGDFGLVPPGGAPIPASTLLDQSGEASAIGIGGGGAVRATVVFPTPELMTDARGYALRIERDGRVPAVIAFGGGPRSGYPVSLAPGATGAFAVALTATCTDRYRTTVRSAGADLDADLGRSGGVRRAATGRRWVTVVLEMTNVTPAGMCQTFSGNTGVVELRLQAGGRAAAPAGDRSFDKIAAGATADRTYVFEVEAGTSELVLSGGSGEVLGRWTAELPPAPGE